MYLLKLSIAQTLSAYFTDKRAGELTRDILEDGFYGYEMLEDDIEAILLDSEEIHKAKHAKRIAKRCIKDIKEKNIEAISLHSAQSLSLFLK